MCVDCSFFAATPDVLFRGFLLCEHRRDTEKRNYKMKFKREWMCNAWHLVFFRHFYNPFHCHTGCCINNSHTVDCNFLKRLQLFVFVITASCCWKKKFSEIINRSMNAVLNEEFCFRKRENIALIIGLRDINCSS